MIIYLDDNGFPPSVEILKSAKEANASQVISQPWPDQYKKLEPGVHEIEDIEPATDGIQDEPITWRQLHVILSSASDLASATTMVSYIMKEPNFPVIIATK